ncbi:MAG: hypothetical protein D8M28_08890 [Proteobacteria bacterium]|nr:hypothetical protein [Pseudomonadota bacterium]
MENCAVSVVFRLSQGGEMHKILQKSSYLGIVFSLFLLTACVHQDARTNSSEYAATPSYLDNRQATLTGAYLAGRFAQNQSDWSAANYYMNQVLGMDDGNKNLLHRSFLLALGDGDMDRALPLARQLVAGGENAELATVILVADAMGRGDAQAAWGYTEMLNGGGFNEYAKPLFQAWVLVMQEDIPAALEKVTAQIETFNRDPVYLLHSALIAEYHGDKKQAEDYYLEVMAAEDYTVYAALTAASFYERDGRTEKAKLIYGQLNEKRNPYRVLSLSHMAEVVGKSASDPRDAVSLLLFELATLLYEREAYDSALIYTRLAEVLTPQSPFVAMMLGDIALHYGDYHAARKYYTAVGDESGMMRFARLKLAEALEAGGHQDEAVAILSDAADEEESYADSLIYLGDIYRRNEQYAEAVRAYSRALGRIGDVKSEHWFVVYARGMSQERLKNWDMAEQDLLKALDLNPENPLVLNYLGYSWVDQGLHLERAMEMIKKAVMLRPEDGYITDSYGWALYQTGALDEAVKWLEYSVERVPYDVTINDHLGDAYWRVGRRVEARFQWERAYNLAKAKSDKERIYRKLEAGLPGQNPGKQPKTVTAEREAMLHR